jgi:quinol monooxygenase YgiN
MASEDRCCTIAPYFKVHAGRMEAFRRIAERFVESTSTEPGCLYYGWSFHGDDVHCREGYADADALLAHVENVGPLIEEALEVADLTRFEIHGPEAELERLREPLKALNATFFTLEYGFRR